VAEQGPDATMTEDAADDDIPGLDDDSGQQSQLWKPEANDTSRWLYELVFSPLNDLEPMPEPDLSATRKSSGTDQVHVVEEPTRSAAPTSNSFGNNSVAPLWHQPDHMKVLLQKRVPNSSVVNELLAEWTTLTEDEIEDIAPDHVQNEKEEATQSKAKGKKPKEKPINFKDCIGRKFSLPFHLAMTWQVGTPKKFN
jgi:hypothetical protein